MTNTTGARPMCRTTVNTILFLLEWVFLSSAARQKVTTVLATPSSSTITKPFFASSVGRATHRALIELKFESSGDFETEGHEDGHRKAGAHSDYNYRYQAKRKKGLLLH
jgi:hypothetical protein